ncbi:MAG: RNA-binding protein [Elusimicrobia bacterium]|nr:RNA-binding protein [Elusimicrobiota bacterium]
MDIYIGNISEDTTDRDLENLFAGYGRVVYVNIFREKNPSSCHGFVGMLNDVEALAAIRETDGTELKGNILSVRQAHARVADRRNLNIKWGDGESGKPSEEDIDKNRRQGRDRRK